MHFKAAGSVAQESALYTYRWSQQRYTSKHGRCARSGSPLEFESHPSLTALYSLIMETQLDPHPTQHCSTTKSKQKADRQMLAPTMPLLPRARGPLLLYAGGGALTRLGSLFSAKKTPSDACMPALQRQIPAQPTSWTTQNRAVCCVP